MKWEKILLNKDINNKNKDGIIVKTDESLQESVTTITKICQSNDNLTKIISNYKI